MKPAPRLERILPMSVGIATARSTGPPPCTVPCLVPIMGLLGCRTAEGNLANPLWALNKEQYRAAVLSILPSQSPHSLEVFFRVLGQVSFSRRIISSAA